MLDGEYLQSEPWKEKLSYGAYACQIHPDRLTGRAILIPCEFSSGDFIVRPARGKLCQTLF